MEHFQEGRDGQSLMTFYFMTIKYLEISQRDMLQLQLPARVAILHDFDEALGATKACLFSFFLLKKRGPGPTLLQAINSGGPICDERSSGEGHSGPVFSWQLRWDRLSCGKGTRVCRTWHQLSKYPNQKLLDRHNTPTTFPCPLFGAECNASLADCLAFGERPPAIHN